LFQSGIRQALVSSRSKMSEVPSPLKMSIWCLLAHEGGCDGPAVADAGTSDGKGIYNALKALDDMPETDRLSQVLVFDTTPLGELSGYKAEVKVRSLFSTFVNILEGIGLNCQNADKLVANPNHIYGYETTNATLIEIYDAYSQQYKFNEDFTRQESEFEIRVPGGPLHAQRGPTIPNKYWGIAGGWSYKLSKIDLDFGYFDDLFLEKLPDDYVDELLKKGWPSLGLLRNKLADRLQSMLQLSYVDSFAVKAAGELRAFFYLCLLYHYQDVDSGITKECHPGGTAWIDPYKFLSVTLPYAIEHGRPKQTAPSSGGKGTTTIIPTNVTSNVTYCPAVELSR
jgi:hypothetical protein